MTLQESDVIKSEGAQTGAVTLKFNRGESTKWPQRGPGPRAWAAGRRACSCELLGTLRSTGWGGTTAPPRQEDPHGVYSYAETPERADK